MSYLETRKARIWFLISASWTIASVLLAIYLVDEREINSVGAFVLVIVLNLPTILLHGVKWIRGGEPSGQALTQQNAVDEKLRTYANLNKPMIALGIKSEMIAFSVFSIGCLAVLGWNVLITLQGKSLVQSYGWGKVPEQILNDWLKLADHDTALMITYGGCWLASAICFTYAYSNIREQLDLLQK